MDVNVRVIDETATTRRTTLGVTELTAVLELRVAGVGGATDRA